MKIKIEVTQIKNGLEYSAVITIDEIVSFKCNLVFGVPISQLDNQKQPKDKAHAMEFGRKLFQFTIKKDDEEIEITDEIFGFLIQVFGIRAINFYTSGQIQDNNNTPTFGKLLDKDSALSKTTGMTASMSIQSSFTVEDIPAVLKKYL